MSVVPVLRAGLLSALVLCLGPMTLAHAAPGAVASAKAGPRTPIVSVTGTGLFSPNGDGKKDKARHRIELTRKADVTVKVTTKRGRVVTRDRLGRLARGTYSWTWNGRNDQGRRVADRTYLVVTVARAVRTDKVATARYSVFVDTVYEPREAVVTDDTLYPSTTVVTDEIWFRNAVSGEGEPAKKWSLRIKDERGRLRYTADWRNDGSGSSYGVGWDGRDDAGRRLPADSYTARLRGTDNAGNTGTSAALDLTISATPLVEASGTATVTAAASQVPGPNYCGGRRPPNGCADAYPCGTVVASTAYLEPEALSYRSAECTSINPDEARGYHKLDPAIDAPRGVIAARVSMRGRPTVSGETDTATLTHGTSVRSAAVDGESVTTTPVSSMWHPQYLTSGVGWLVTTVGTDSYDVAAFSIDYTYLTPQR